jgi:hypothetical protein
MRCPSSCWVSRKSGSMTRTSTLESKFDRRQPLGPKRIERAGSSTRSGTQARCRKATASFRPRDYSCRTCCDRFCQHCSWYRSIRSKSPRPHSDSNCLDATARLRWRCRRSERGRDSGLENAPAGFALGWPNENDGEAATNECDTRQHPAPRRGDPCKKARGSLDSDGMPP